MRPKRPTSWDVARLAGVSRATVSVVLNERHDIRVPEETRSRVREAADRLGYFQNAAARSLVTGRAGRIGVLTYNPMLLRTNVDDMFHAEVMTALFGALADHGYDALVHMVDPHDEAQVLERVRRSGAEGLVVVGLGYTAEFARKLQLNHFPVVYAFRYPPGPEFWHIDVDNHAAGATSVEHLVANGHREIAYVQVEDVQYAYDRRAGAIAAAERHGIALQTVYIPDLECRRDDPTLGTFLAEMPVTAVATDNEFTAYRVIERFAETGLRVPDDRSVIGVNSTPRCETYTPRLTAVRVPIADMMTESVQMLSEFHGVRPDFVRQRKLPVTVDERESVRPRVR
ncbi:MAG: LacI family DNA-binding transcriptional regulator [Fimbriimonadaceae bacterium]|nr:LacI family DNA-binding transcriptional regulator [Fimbriimonadaceae bacterium]